MQYIAIVDWAKHQHYKDRNPPWIKLHTKLLENERFEGMKDTEKAHLMLLWLLAARKNNRIPAEKKWLARHSAAKTRINLAPLIEAGFIKLVDSKENDNECEWASRYVPKEYRQLTLKKYNNKCVKCKSIKDLEIDHILPISKGGDGELDNLQVLCRKCNRKKHCDTTDARQMLDKSKTDAASETETETETKADKESEAKRETEFDNARKIYLGNKGGNRTEYENFKKKHKDWQAVLPLLKPAIERLIKWRNEYDGFVPDWKHFKTWINNRCWEDELPRSNNGQPNNKKTRGGFAELDYKGKDDDLTYRG